MKVGTNDDPSYNAAGQPPRHPFSADRPVRSREDDVLNRRGFAEALGEAAAGWKGDDSLVLALYGAWGIGKTSVVNMALETLGTDRKVVWFNPWEWSGHEEIAAAFFAEVGTVLGEDDASMDAHRRARLWLEYAAALKVSSVAAGSVRPLVAAAAVLMTVFGLGGAFVEGPLLKVGGIVVAVIGVLSLVLTLTQSLASGTGEFFERRAVARRKTLSETKDALRASLRGLANPLVIVLDDIDRLTPPEILRVFQLVKANADFPKLVYLLPFDQVAVAASVSKVIEVSGSDYIEKIVQVGLDIPRIERSRLEAMLLADLNRVLAPRPVDALFSNERFSELYLSGLNGYLATPRDAKRFVSTLEFMVGLHLEGESFNVNPVDLIGIEAFRVFVPSVFAALDEARDILTGASSGSEQDRAAAERRIRTIIERAEESKRPLAEGMLRVLFPAVSWALKGTGIFGNTRRWHAERRVCDVATFSRYFAFAVPGGDISEGEVDEVVSSLSGDRTTTVRLLRNLADRNLIGVFIGKLRAEPSRVPSEKVANFLAALFDVGDDLSSRSNILSGIVSESLEAVFLISDMLDPMPKNVRAGVLTEAIHNSSGVHLPVYFASLDLHRHDRGSDPTFPLDELEPIKTLALAKLRVFVREGGLVTSRHVSTLLHALVEWGSKEEASEAAQRASDSPSGLSALLTSFRTRSYSGGRPNEFQLEQVEPYLDLDATAVAASEWLATGDVNSEDSEVLRAFVAAMPVYRKGQYGNFSGSD